MDIEKAAALKQVSTERLFIDARVVCGGWFESNPASDHARWIAYGPCLLPQYMKDYLQFLENTDQRAA